MLTLSEVCKLLTHTLCDSYPKTGTDAAYLYGQTTDNQPSVFQAVRHLLANSLTSKVLILNNKAESGYPGFTKWKHQLENLGIAGSQIVGVEVEDTSTLNTLTEAEALIEFAQRQGLRSLFVVAPPFHQLRAFMAAVTVALREYPQLLIYSYPGVALPWHEEVVHSQGTLTAKRIDLILTELESIEQYQNEGVLASFAQVLSYLNERDTTV